MGHSFVFPNGPVGIPRNKDSQIRIILERRAVEVVWRKFGWYERLSRVTDYRRFFDVTFKDLLDFTRDLPEEIRQLLPWEPLDRP